MICSTSCSSSARRPAPASVVVLALLSILAGCRHSAPKPELPASERLVVFPVQNAAGGMAAIRSLGEALDAQLAARGVAVVPRSELDLALARNRIRFTGGVDRRLAKILREELGAGLVLIPTLEQYVVEVPPKVALTVRLADTSDRPMVHWADGVARAGNDSPGLLGIGIMRDVRDVERVVVKELSRSVARRLSSHERGAYCGEAGRFEPRRTFRAPVLDDIGRRSIAVLPFVNRTKRRSAGDVLVGQFVAQLARTDAFEVLDPGLIREELLGHRIVLEGGVSVDAAMALLDLLDADFVLSGYVEVFEAKAGSGAPKVEFSAYVIDRSSSQLVWSSTSTGTGNDGVFFFGAGRVHSVAQLSCRMVEGVVDEIVGKRAPLAAAK